MSTSTGPTSFEFENDTIRSLIQDLDVHEPGEAGHSERVSVYAAAVGHHIGLPFEVLVHLRRAAALHDIGKISVDQSVLSKMGKLEDSDIQELRAHSILAMEFVESFDWLAPTMPMIKHHHERWDGRGYPDGLVGDLTPIGARIIGACEAFDVLVSGSPWSKAVTENEALAELRNCAGSQFDPSVVEALTIVQPLIQPVYLRE